MTDFNPYQSSADTGSGDVGVNLDAHITGDPIGKGGGGKVTVGHTWLIIVLALAALWLLAGGFRKIRMG